MLSSPQFALMATFIALCATAQPSPFAVPLSYYLVYGVTDEHWQAFCDFCASKGVTEYGMIAWGIPGVAALVYWFNGLLLLALGACATRPAGAPQRHADPHCGQLRLLCAAPGAQTRTGDQQSCRSSRSRRINDSIGPRSGK